MNDTVNSNEPDMNCGVHYFQEHLTAIIHHFYITGDVGLAVNYIEMIHTIRSAAPNDIIKIHLNTVGGCMDTGIQIINAIRESHAHVVCELEAQAFSVGSLIFLSGDEFVVHDNAVLMIHNFSGMVFGKGHEQRSRLDAVTDWFHDFARPLYVPFISEEEFDFVLDGKDMWMHSSEIGVRIEHMVDEKMAAIEAATKKPRKRKPSSQNKK